MQFISMDVIGEFHPRSSTGNFYALFVICMLTGYSFCILLPNKSACIVVQAYVDNVYAKFGGPTHILSDNGNGFKNQLFTPFHQQSNGRIEGFHHSSDCAY